MLAFLSKVANGRRFLWIFYYSWVRVPVRPERLLSISRRTYTAQCIALALLISSGSSFLVDCYVGDNRTRIISTLADVQLKLSELVPLQPDDENRRFIKDNIKLFGLDETNLAGALQQLSHAASLSRITSPAIYPLIVEAASLVFALLTSRRSSEDFRKSRTIFHLTFLSFVVFATGIMMPLLVINTQFSIIQKITEVRSINLECWIGVTDPNGTEILLQAAQSIGRDAGVFYNLDKAFQTLMLYALVFVVLGIVWTLVRIRLLTRMPMHKLLAGFICSLIVYATLNLLYAAFVPTYSWVASPPEPCIGRKE